MKVRYNTGLEETNINGTFIVQCKVEDFHKSLRDIENDWEKNFKNVRMCILYIVPTFEMLTIFYCMKGEKL